MFSVRRKARNQQIFLALSLFDRSILNLSPSTSLQYDCPLSVWLREYNVFQDNYIQDITLLRTLGRRVYVKIPTKNRLKSGKIGSLSGQESYFIVYIITSIYRIYFPDTRKVKIIRDVEFVGFSENDDSLKAYQRDGNLFSFRICHQLIFQLIAYLHHFLPTLLLKGRLKIKRLKNLIIWKERVKYHQLPIPIVKSSHVGQQESVMYLKNTVLLLNI